jgi:glycerate kinase
MRIVVAPDKFKNSLTGLEFCKAVEEGIKAVLKSDVDIVKLPLADGGDGTIEVVNYYLKGEVIHVEVNNPFFQPIKASYLYSESSKTAFIEMAEASGVKLLKPEQFDCKNATSLGTGEIIVDAIKKGAQKIILGIGGSATNDCGIGMATALGYQFLDKNNNEVKPIGANLSQIESIDVSNVHDRLYEVDFSVACDVTNPLYGSNGAAYVYGAQKGASTTDIMMLDKGLEDFSKILNAVFNIDAQSVKGAGAAGGMGIASKVFLNGDLKSGIELVKYLADFDAKIKNSEWIITGEGRLDSQTFSGKTIKGIVDSAKKDGIKIAAFCGSTNLNSNSIKDFGIDYVDLVDNYSKNKNDAIQNGLAYLRHIAKIFAKKLA